MMATNFDKIADEAGQTRQTFPLVKTTTHLGAMTTPVPLTIDGLLAETRRYLSEHDSERIQRAYDLAFKAHKGAVRRSGEPYIQHPLEVAYLLAGMRIDAEGIMSALLHDVVEDTDYSLDDLREQFGPAVAHIVDGVTKFNVLSGHAPDEAASSSSSSSAAAPLSDALPVPAPSSLVDKRRVRIETVRKMLLAMAEDPRVVVLKLADRLHNMSTLGVMSPAQQQNTARETSEIFAPLARRLGMALVQADLEDLAFRYLEPEKYKRLERQVEEEVKRRLPFVNEVCRILNEEMERAGIKAEVLAWQKHLASINRKLEDAPLQTGMDLGQIHDLISFRILVNTDYECYLALGHIHALWRPKDGRIKDFIAIPKVNGYQSLHTTVFCLDNRLADIQIRTHDMQRTADYGVASYWYLRDRLGKASNGGTDEGTPGSWRLSYREMVGWIEQLREWQQALPQGGADEFVEAFKGDIFQEQIFVFTPKGEVKDLPRGSTPLDMAYRIHTDIGDHCAGARIITNMDDSGRLVTRLVPLDYELKDGEIVDIVTNGTVHPTRDWLSFARTAAARNKIRRYLKTYEREINMQIGLERLDMALKAAGICSGVDKEVEKTLKRFCADASKNEKTDTDDNVFHSYRSLDDIYNALGRDELKVDALLEPLFEVLPRKQNGESKKAHPEQEPGSENTTGTYHYEGEGAYANLVHLAQCCCPLPGDPISGLLMPGQGMVVHCSDCSTLRRNHEQSADIVEVNWRQIHPDHYLVQISLVAYDRAGLLRDVAAVVADASVNMIAVTSTTNTASQKAVIMATLEISTDISDAANTGILEALERILRRLRQVKSVVSVERATVR